MLLVHTDRLTVPQAAKEAGVSRQEIWQKIKRGTLMATKIGRDWHIDRSEWDRYRREAGAKDSPADSPGDTTTEGGEVDTPRQEEE